jgi:hypothetical protein
MASSPIAPESAIPLRSQTRARLLLATTMARPLRVLIRARPLKAQRMTRPPREPKMTRKLGKLAGARPLRAPTRARMITIPKLARRLRVPETGKAMSGLLRVGQLRATILTLTAAIKASALVNYRQRARVPEADATSPRACRLNHVPIVPAGATISA